MSTTDIEKKPKAYFSASQDSSIHDVDFRAMIGFLMMNKIFILLTVLVFLMAGGLYAWTRSPSYQSSAMIQIRAQENTGATNVLAMMSSAGVLRATASNSDIQIALIRSRYVLGEVARKLHLDISASPRKVPVLASLYGKFHDSDQLASPFLGMSRYNWGGESIAVEKIQLPPGLVGIEFTLVAEKNGRYALYAPDKTKILEGKVGEYAQSDDLNYPVGIEVKTLVANPGAEFRVKHLSQDDIADQLSGRLTITEQGSSTGIFRIDFISGIPAQAKNLLDAILIVTQNKSIQDKLEDTKKTLAFLGEHLQDVQEELNHAETTLVNYEVKSGAMSLETGSSILTDQYSTILQALEELRLQKQAMLQKFTPNHPYILAINERESQLEKQVLDVKSALAKLPKESLEVAHLNRNVGMTEKLYSSIAENIQSLEVVQGGTVSAVKVLSSASYPVFPVASQTSKIMAVSFLLGLMLSIAIVFIRKALMPVIEDPGVIEKVLEIPTLAIIPFSRHQDNIAKQLEENRVVDKHYLLSKEKSKDLSIEALRSLRTALKLRILSSTNNIITISGCSPNVGKSFISVNMAVLFADLGSKVLFIDTDMRKGHTNKYFGRPKTPGLSEYLEGKNTYDEVLQRDIFSGIDFIATGKYPANPSELLMNNQLSQLLDSVANNYDVVIIDTPPVLAVTDAAVVLKHSATNLLVIGAGKDQLKEVQHAVGILRKNSITLEGTIFNSTNTFIGKYGYGYGYGYGGYGGYGYGKYNYYYSYESDK